jgi:hypothetical protein
MMQDADFVMRTDPGLFHERSDLCVWHTGLLSENVGVKSSQVKPRLQAAAAAIGALHLEDIEEQRGLFDGEEAVSEGERDAHGARLSELQRAACRRRTSMHQVVYRRACPAC